MKNKQNRYIDHFHKLYEKKSKLLSKHACGNRYHFARILKRNKNPLLTLSFAGFYPLNHDGGGDHGDPRDGGGHVSFCPAASYRCR